MQKEEIARCTKLAEKHLKLEGAKKEMVRNELYLCLQPYMMKWLQAILGQKKLYWEPDEMLSESWSCFEFCLGHFKPKNKIPLPNHFYSYAKFYIAMLQSAKRQANGQQEFKEDLSYMTINQADLNVVYEELDELRCFKDSLPEEYQPIFDDALMSMVGCLNDRIRRLDETPVKYYRYCESKKIFRMLIAYLLRR